MPPAPDTTLLDRYLAIAGTAVQRHGGLSQTGPERRVCEVVGRRRARATFVVQRSPTGWRRDPSAIPNPRLPRWVVSRRHLQSIVRDPAPALSDPGRLDLAGLGIRPAGDDSPDARTPAYAGGKSSS